MIFFYTLIVCFLINTAAAQVFINELTKNAIPNVTLLSKEGKVIQVSDKNGAVTSSVMETKFGLIGSDTIEFVHPNFIGKKMGWKSFKNQKKIELTPITALDEVVLIGNSRDYIVLKAYFMSYQIIDDTPQSFSDGLIEYYLSPNRNKIIDFNILQTRVFKNDSYIREFNKKVGHHTLNIGSSIQPFNFKEELLLNRWKDFDFTPRDKIILKKDTIGFRERNINNSQIFVAFYTPKRNKTQSVLGITSKVENYIIGETFNHPTPSVEELKNISKYYQSYITQKKITFKYELIQNIQILDKRRLPQQKYRSSKSFYNHSYKTGYDEDYWHQQEYMKIPKTIKKLMDKNILSIKK